MEGRLLWMEKPWRSGGETRRANGSALSTSGPPFRRTTIEPGSVVPPDAYPAAAAAPRGPLRSAALAAEPQAVRRHGQRMSSQAPVRPSRRWLLVVAGLAI